ncbi:hypothetical protein [Halobacillus salinus]|uniref:hypothetical protein n=1 Tax=Halobacillus salinus TaxID=192814 RepID=UPI0009A5BB71|nr:hypothetical protein [Halobacillus salinus]
MKIKRIFAVLMAMMLLVPSLAFADSNESGKTPVQSPAADLRADFGELLAAHYEYQILTAIKKYQDAPDADVAQEMLEKNAGQMKAAIKSIYGQEGADQFAEIFASQYEDSASLGTAMMNDDKEMTDQAKQSLTQDFPKELGAFLDTATEGNLPAETAEKVLMAHEQDVIDVTSHYINGDYEKAYDRFDEGYKRMYEVGTALSQAIVKQMPEKFNNTKVVTPASDLRVTFNQLLGVHYSYQTLTSLKQTQGADDADVVTEKLEENAMDMKAAIKSIYGQKGADQFAEIFASQYEDSANLGMAMMNEDTDQTEQVKQSLTQDFPKELGAFLETATEGNLPAETAEKVLMAHEQDVIDVVNAYMNEDYETAYMTYDEGFKRMSTIGTAVSGAIATQMPDKFSSEMMPESMPDTGMGGTADQQSLSTWAWVSFIILAAGGGLFLYRKNSVQ